MVVIVVVSCLQKASLKLLFEQVGRRYYNIEGTFIDEIFDRN